MLAYFFDLSFDGPCEIIGLARRFAFDDLWWCRSYPFEFFEMVLDAGQNEIVGTVVILECVVGFPPVGHNAPVVEAIFPSLAKHENRVTSPVAASFCRLASIN